MRKQWARVSALSGLVLLLGSMSYPTSAESAGEASDAHAALDRAAAFMGGADTIATMRTLVVASESRMEHERQRVVVPSRTWYAFPLSVRREITVNGRTLAWASAPGGATLFTADGSVPLNEATRQSLERSTMRDPVVLLKSRLGRGFHADVAGSTTVDGITADIVRLRQFGNETLLIIARDDGRPVEIRFRNPFNTAQDRDLVVRWSDWKHTSAGLRYPHRATGTANGVVAFETVVLGVEINPSLSDSLFHGEGEQASYGVQRH